MTGAGRLAGSLRSIDLRCRLPGHVRRLLFPACSPATTASALCRAPGSLRGLLGLSASLVHRNGGCASAACFPVEGPRWWLRRRFARIRRENLEAPCLGRMVGAFGFSRGLVGLDSGLIGGATCCHAYQPARDDEEDRHEPEQPAQSRGCLCLFSAFSRCSSATAWRLAVRRFDVATPPVEHLPAARRERSVAFPRGLIGRRRDGRQNAVLEGA